MKISIIIPTYNAELFLEKTIISIINQSYKNYEIIIIDGDSTDNTKAIIAKYERYISYYITEKDSGQSDAINKGMEQITGEIWAWQNSDDIYYPKCFEIVADYFSKNKTVDMIYGNVNYIDSNETVLYSRNAWKYDYDKMRRGRFIPTQPTVFFSKRVKEKIGLLNVDLNYVMDYDFFIRIGRQYSIRKINEYLGAFRIHSESKTSSEKNYQRVRAEYDSMINAYSNNSLVDNIIIKYYKYYSILAFKIKYSWRFSTHGKK